MALYPIALFVSYEGYHRAPPTAYSIIASGAPRHPSRRSRRTTYNMENSARGHSGGVDRNVNDDVAGGMMMGGGCGGGGKGGNRPRILCLHGRYQSAAIFSNKIGGARRRIERDYDMHFLDGPILLPMTTTTRTTIAGDDDDVDDDVVVAPIASYSSSRAAAVDDDDDDDAHPIDDPLAPRSWWSRSEDAKEHTLVREAFECVLRHVESLDDGDGGGGVMMMGDGCYDAILGFSQGGTLATALALSGVLGPRLRAVVTAGAPCVDEAFIVASELANGDHRGTSSSSTMSTPSAGGYDVPKLHFAGSTDALVPISSTEELCVRGGNGRLIVHDRGHLFPTRSAMVKEVLDFLDESLSSSKPPPSASSTMNTPDTFC
ncbi:hypothetical protein ACHAXA_011141 [Cyclostephanos tholiformis]|uniref:Serine hydrolase domain-containing protein n=1 Tax=Cyclostephanos tholiformis TaxID=382380 RepID=A0ABD3SEV5_9STRA